MQHSNLKKSIGGNFIYKSRKKRKKNKSKQKKSQENKSQNVLFQLCNNT